MTRENLFSAFFFAAFFFLLVQLYRILAPFASPLILATILALTLAPVTRQVVRALGGSRTRAAIAMSLGTAAILLVPMAVLLSILAEQATEIYESVQGSVASGGETPLAASESWLSSARTWLVGHFPAIASLDLAELSSNASKRAAEWIASEAQVVVGDLASGMFGGVMMLLALFFFFRDGDQMSRAVTELIPMEPAQKDRLIQRFSDTVAAVVQSTVLIALLQGLVGGLGYALIGRFSVSVLLGFLTAAASLVPAVGSALVWAPAALYLLATGEILRGGLLVAWGLVVVGSVDNFVRPLVIGGRVEIPTFLLLFALFGGLQVYGFLGIFIAPVVVAVLLGFTDIYRERYVPSEPSGEPSGS